MAQPLARFGLATLVWSVVVSAAAPAPASSPSPSSVAQQASAAGAAALRRGAVYLACEAFARAVRALPASAPQRLALARCLRVAGDPGATASEHLRRVEREPRHAPAALVEAGRLAEDQGDLRAAAERYRAASARGEPAHGQAEEGSARTAPVRSLATLERLRRLVRRHPRRVAAWARLAQSAEALGHLQEAEAALMEVLERSTSPAWAAGRLGAFGERTGRASAIARARRGAGR